MKVNLSAI